MQTHTLTSVVSAECWNKTSGDMYDLPTGTLLKVEHPNSKTHMTCMAIDNEGKAVELFPGAYRFIIPNSVLNIQDRTFDLISSIIAYETGSSSKSETKKLFKHLKENKIQLQGHYSSKL